MTYAASMNAIARWGAGLFVGLALAVAGPGGALAQQSGAAGSFVAVTGDVKILRVDGVTRAAAAGDAFRQGDSIVTGADGLAQLRMTDGSALSVRLSSRLRLDRYRYAGKEDRDPSFFVSIVRGGFRTITGLISRLRRDNYRVTTPVAALGVRGTDFEIVHVEQPLPDAAPGTYDRVYEGVTALHNRVGVELLVSRGQTAFVALPGDLAPVLVAPPGSIFGESTAAPAPGQRSGNETEGESESGTAAAPVLINPIDTPTVTASPVLSAPVTSTVGPIDATLSPTLSVPVSATVTPTQTTVTASPTLTAPVSSSVGPIEATASPTLSAPVSATVTPTQTTVTASPTLAAPVTTTVAPITTTLSPTLSAPVSATVSPTLTTPTTVTVSPTLTAPVTTTVAPITTTLSPTLSVPITVTVSPTSPASVTAAPALTAPVTTTIAPTLTAPVTTTIQNLTSTTGKLLGQ